MKMLVLLVVAACLMSTTALARDVAAGEERFRICTPCHAIGEGAANRVGPALNEIVGRPAASVPGFAYSQVLLDMRDSGLVWTPEQLAAFLASPREFAPGNKMSFAGIKSETEIANLIAYLATFTTIEKRPAPPTPEAPRH